MRKFLVSTAPSRRVDIEAVADRWSRGLPIIPVPFGPQMGWASRVTVLVDKSHRLVPFFSDQDHVLGRLRKQLGTSGVREIQYREGLAEPWRDRRRSYRIPPADPGQPVLALGDLGYFGGARDRRVWRAVGRILQHRGSYPVALVPCPADRWPRGQRDLWSAIDWSRPGRIGRPRQQVSGAELKARGRRLLSLASFASRIEPGLLRQLRGLHQLHEADLGTEADAWALADLSFGFVPYTWLSAETSEALRAEFREESDSLKRRAVEIQRNWRAGLPREIWNDEVVALSTAGGLPAGTLSRDEETEALSQWQRLAETLESTRSTSPTVLRGLREFTRASIEVHQPPEAWQDPLLREALWRAWQVAWQGEGPPPFPKGAGPEVLPPGNAVSAWSLSQVGAELHFQGPASEESGSPLARLESANGIVGIWLGVSPLAPQLPLDLAPPFPLPQSSTLTLRTDRTAATLRRIYRPEWAKAMGRDRFGLWASFEVAGVSQKMRWIPPGRFYMGSPENEPGRFRDEGPRHLETVPEGFWLADTACTQELWQAVMGKNPSQFPSSDRPVERVSWDDATTFFRTLNKRVEGLASRFPSEVEWEFACRAGSQDATYAGPLEVEGGERGKALEDIAWYSGNSEEGFELEGGGRKKGTHPVAQKDRNSWGLYDMLGNVLEWCQDTWRKTYDSNPVQEGARRAIRGGSWYYDARHVRAAYRVRFGPLVRSNDLGFRLAQDRAALRQEAERVGEEPQSAQRRSSGLATGGAATEPGQNRRRKSGQKDAAK